jgi:hypothetical protein
MLRYRMYKLFEIIAKCRCDFFELANSIAKFFQVIVHTYVIVLFLISCAFIVFSNLFEIFQKISLGSIVTQEAVILILNINLPFCPYSLC